MNSASSHLWPDFGAETPNPMDSRKLVKGSACLLVADLSSPVAEYCCLAHPALANLRGCRRRLLATTQKWGRLSLSGESPLSRSGFYWAVRNLQEAGPFVAASEEMARLARRRDARNAVAAESQPARPATVHVVYCQSSDSVDSRSVRSANGLPYERHGDRSARPQSGRFSRPMRCGLSRTHSARRRRPVGRSLRSVRRCAGGHGCRRPLSRQAMRHRHV